MDGDRTVFLGQCFCFSLHFLWKRFACSHFYQSVLLASNTLMKVNAGEGRGEEGRRERKQRGTRGEKGGQERRRNEKREKEKRGEGGRGRVMGEERGMSERESRAQERRWICCTVKTANSVYSMVGSPHLSCLPVVVHAWLTILRRVDGVSLAKLDPPSLLQRVEVPADKGVKVRVGICCDEGASPVNLCVCACACACV